ncbi:FKBP-type peptidyl-prolyl cis-trans isomerase [Negadavirga shengliensis]|uniref:Peptidyl-prolyl cis-trans isomerase n=1 Tax=Negadavirga shengliensis TaxID=1389218 RepID=A0ABV9SVF4_9BACT
MRYLNSVLILVVSLGFLACNDQGNWFGPVYDVEGNLARDRGIIDEYLQTADFDSISRIHDPSGVVVIVKEEGTGSRPQSGNTVYANYIGYLLDGSVFDSNLEDVAKENDIHDEERNYDIFSFLLDVPAGQGGAIEGFNFGFKRLRSGARATLIIPSPHGYRDNENIPRIPPNSVLVFDVEFLGMD